MNRAGALIRLISSAAGTHAHRTGATQRSAEEFFQEVLDQTGNGWLDWPDLAAMARELSSRLDLDEPEETQLYNAFADWWRELQSALDTDGDGRISAEEYAAAAASLAGPALIKVAEVLFDATDKDGNEIIDATNTAPCSAPPSNGTQPARRRPTRAARSSRTSCPS